MARTKRASASKGDGEARGGGPGQAAAAPAPELTTPEAAEPKPKRRAKAARQQAAAAGDGQRAADPADAVASLLAQEAAQQAQAQAQAQPQAQAQAQAQVPSRREAMAEVARRRAAHFARFDDEGDAPAAETGWCGPLAIARSLASARPAAAAARAASESAPTPTASPHPDAAPWAPRLPLVSPLDRRRRSPETLSSLCAAVVARQAADGAVASLYALPAAIRESLARALAARRGLTPATLPLFFPPAANANDAITDSVNDSVNDIGPVDVALDDCALLDECALSPPLASHRCRLRSVDLGHCGRAITDRLVAAVFGPGRGCPVESLALRGAYRLSDAGVSAIVAGCSGLLDLAVTDCPRLTDRGLESLIHGPAPPKNHGLESLCLDRCAGLGTSLGVPLSTLAARGTLRRLSLSGLPLLPDAGLAAVLRAGGRGLESLDASCCPLVGDVVAAAAGATCPRLRRLDLSGCDALSDHGLESLGRCGAIASLGLRRCRGLRDGKALVTLIEAVGAGLTALELGGHPGADDAVLGALARRSPGLTRLDVSFCRAVTDAGLGCLVDACPRLETLVAWGDSQISERFLGGHGAPALSVVGL